MITQTLIHMCMVETIVRLFEITVVKMSNCLLEMDSTELLKHFDWNTVSQ